MTENGVQTRRSHAERRAETIALIVDAAIDAITELGLRNATTGEICRRAGVSPGAMFHYFETRQDVIVAAVEHLLQQRLARFTAYLDSVQTSDHPADPRAVLRLLRRVSREPRSMVWLEVLMETRTDADLRVRMTPLLNTQRDMFWATAELHPGLQSMPEMARHAWLELLRNVMHGESIFETIEPHHDLDEPKLDALLALALDLGATRPPQGS